jgi:hypothetical protein
MIGAAIGLIALVVAGYFWSHESPRLRRKRELEEKKRSEDDRKAQGDLLEEFGKKLILELTGKPATPFEQKEIARIADSSAAKATWHVMGGGMIAW